MSGVGLGRCFSLEPGSFYIALVSGPSFGHRTARSSRASSNQWFWSARWLSNFFQQQIRRLTLATRPTFASTLCTKADEARLSRSFESYEAPDASAEPSFRPTSCSSSVA